jgi:hypothetical protein
VTNTNFQGDVETATHNRVFESTARAGYTISGVLHLLVAYIIARIAIGSGGTADQSGALATVAGHTGGHSHCGSPRSRWWRWHCGGSPNPWSASTPANGQSTTLERFNVSRPSAWRSRTLPWRTPR